MTVNNEIKAGDNVIVLSEYHLLKGKCIRVNAKSITVELPAQSSYRASTIRPNHEKVAHIDDICSVVWELNRGPNGAYGIDYGTYPDQEKNIALWKSPYFIDEKSCCV